MLDFVSFCICFRRRSLTVEEDSDAAKGGVATSWMLREMALREMAPAALLLNDANPIMAQGAAFAGLSFIDRFDQVITQAVRDGERVTVDPAAGTLTIHRQD